LSGRILSDVNGISQGISASYIAFVLGGTGQVNCSGWYSAKCPVHNDHRNSLSLRDSIRGIIVKCFAGCAPAAVKVAIAELLADPQKLRPFRPQSRSALLLSSSTFITRTWQEGQDPHGTLTEVYLNSRGLVGRIPNSLRHHPDLWHKESRTAGPAMLALITDAAGNVVALHRTWIARNGIGKAELEPVRKTVGPTLGGSIRLGTPDEAVVAGEGVESTLSATMLFRRPGLSGRSADGVAAMQMPAGVRDVLITPDNDAPGLRAAESLYARLKREGLTVEIAVPPVPDTDFNDILLGRTT
jgi:hypothetical protein